MLDLSTIPILDHHCHALLRRQEGFTAVEFQRFFTESTDLTMHAEHVPHTIFFRWATKELAGFHGCEPTPAAVLTARNACAPVELAQRMFEDAKIATLLLDYGFGGRENYRYQELREFLPCRIEPILRLETLAQELIVQHATFGAMVEAFVAAVENARATGHVALKSIAAYRTGLHIQPAERADAALLFATLRAQAEREGNVRLAHKPFNDYLLLLALEIAERQRLPVQFHTGFGDNDLDMLLANPFHMRYLFECGRFTNVPFVLLHAAYPYVRELGYLAAIYSNVWIDMGLAIPHVSSEIPAIWRQVLGLTPTSKVLFSTDAYSIPEIFWLAARWGRQGLATVLTELVDLGALTEDEAMVAATQILHDNAAQLYGLSDE
ncbi:MAG: amidohydrolase family protein [Caldilineaceae bacterium]|nr:amidohydrolase family protein [Caldilineaceae bacterium]